MSNATTLYRAEPDKSEPVKLEVEPGIDWNVLPPGCTHYTHLTDAWISLLRLDTARRYRVEERLKAAHAQLSQAQTDCLLAEQSSFEIRANFNRFLANGGE